MTDPPAPSLDAVLAPLPAELRAIARDLLLYKSFTAGDWFATLGASVEHEEEVDVLRTIYKETFEEAAAVIRAVEVWAATGSVPSVIQERLHVRLLGDLLHLKESTTEACLLAGMRAPTNALRLEFVRLADMDRRHADALRGLLGTPGVSLLQGGGAADGDSSGAYEGRGDAPSFSSRLTRAVDVLRADGQEPRALIMSPVALRHARDEGLLGPDDGTALGLQVEVDFGWRGECFAVLTRERVTLAEIIAERTGRRTS